MILFITKFNKVCESYLYILSIIKFLSDPKTIMQSDRQRSLSPRQYNFKTALNDFQKLKQENTLPYKMQLKLQYLENTLLNRKITIQEYRQLPEYELDSLEQCDKASQMNLFISIVKCLSGKQLIVYFKNQKAFIKKEQAFSMWTKCYLSCDSNYLYVKKKIDKKTNYFEFKITKLKASKKYLQYKKKMCFGLLYDNNKYMLGFQQETACERIFKTIRQLVKENQPHSSSQTIRVMSNSKIKQNNPDSQPSYSERQIITLSSNQKNTGPSSKTLQILQFSAVKQRKNSSGSIMQFQRDQSEEESQAFIKKQHQVEFNQLLWDEIKKQAFSSDKEYKLVKNFQLGRILVSNADEHLKEVKIKISGIFSLSSGEALDCSWLLQQYLSMKNWNLQVEQCKIINKISTSSYKIYIQFKKYSIMSLTRWTIAIVTGVILDKKVYLLIRSCDQLTEQQQVLGNSMSSTRMKKFDQTVEICKKSQIDQKVLITIITNADFGGYCSKSDNLNMSLHVLDNMVNFHNFLMTQSIAKQYEENTNQLFQLSYDDIFSKNDQSQFSQTSKFMNRPNMITGSLARKNPHKQSITNSQFSVQEPQEESQILQQKQVQFPKHNHKRSQIKQISPINILPIGNKINSVQVEQMVFKEFIKQIQLYNQTEKYSQNFVQFVQKKLYQKYFLKYRFPMESNYDQDALKYNSDPVFDNWLTQKGRWKINGFQLIFTNEQILAQQKNIIKLIIKQLGSNVLAGKNIMSMSLPVQIFENMSFLEKLSEVYGYFPYFFNKAAQQNNIIKQITYICQGLTYATTIVPNIQKPFNPILGETYQCVIGGVNFAFQQICHHPPISSFYAKTDQFQCYGNHNPSVEMGLNSALAKNLNPMNVRLFQSNTKYIAYGQDFQIGGLMFGQRTYKNSGKVIVFEQKNDILCEISFGKQKKNIYESNRKLKTGQIVGGVYKVANSFAKRLKSQNRKNFDGIKYDQKIQELAKISGNWLGDFFIDNVQVKGMWDIPPNVPIKQTYLLPSDCTFRMDIYYKRTGDIKKSQQWKQIMENSQRKDRKLREQHQKHHHHSKKH